MIITRTPFRVSFAGGGSDLEEYYLNYGGSVVSTSVDKYVYLSMHPYFHEDRFLLKYSSNEHTDNVRDIKHRIIRQVFLDYNISGVDFNSSADIPAGTGMGSSSAFTSGLITLCNAYVGAYMSKEDIANYACDIEISKLKEPIGKQDQYACAVGGLNFIKFNQDGSVSIEKIIMNSERLEELENSLLLFYLGNTRSTRSILSQQKENIKSSPEKLSNMHKIVSLSEELKCVLQGTSNIGMIGDILHSGWMYKRELTSQISDDRIDHYYDLALKYGATGGKLLGAGGGGFLLFYVPVDKQENVRNSLSDLDELNFQFDHEGTKVIYYNT